MFVFQQSVAPSDVRFILHVHDTNDNPPQFQQLPYNAEVNEVDTSLITTHSLSVLSLYQRWLSSRCMAEKQPILEQFGSPQCNTMQCNTIQCTAIQDKTKQEKTRQDKTTRHDTIQYINTPQQNTVQCNAMQLSPTQQNVAFWNSV